jgi:hypothetical protein
VSVNHNIEGLESYLEHPIKQHFLLKHLPLDLQQGLVENRKYVFSIFDCVTIMVINFNFIFNSIKSTSMLIFSNTVNQAYMGLVQLGPRLGKVSAILGVDHSIIIFLD